MRTFTIHKQKPMKTIKEIRWAFPTSPAASQLGFSRTGCYYVGKTHIDIEGSGQCRSFIPHNAEGFADRNDPSLASLFNEEEGEPMKGGLL